MNSREKGKRGERQWRDVLRAHGYTARRGQRFAGSAESADVICGDLPWAHFEVKAVERLNIEDAMEQARCDARRIGKSEGRGPKSEEGERVPVVAHRRRFRRWLVTMEAEAFFRLVRGELSREGREGGENDLTAEGAKSAEGYGKRTGGGNGQWQRADGKAGLATDRHGSTRILGEKLPAGAPEVTGEAPVLPESKREPTTNQESALLRARLHKERNQHDGE